MGITRREALAGATLFGLGAGMDRLLPGSHGTASSRSGAGTSAEAAVPFYGRHQPGIATPAQEYLCFAAFDVTERTIGSLHGLLQTWTDAAVALQAGETYQPVPQNASQPPIDTGEALELAPSQLTLTFGFGPGLFEPTGLGLAGGRPASLRPLPPFRGESLQSARSGGDLCVQACANDPQVAFHAIHVLARLGNGTAVLRWAQLGFGRTSSTSREQATPRNLMGFKDGTNNIRAEDERAMSEYVWVQAGDGPAWMTGGTYLIARRIKIILDVWDATSLDGQQRVIGRYKSSGAPLGGRQEYDPVDLQAHGSDGEPVIPQDSHIRLASHETNGGARILRRGYSFSEAPEPGSGLIEAGLFFIAFQRDPRQFITIQQRLGASDALNRHTLHTSSAIFACPPGVAQGGGHIGEGLFV